MSGAEPLVLKFGGSLVEQLGAQLYPSVTATVAELISNAWDADAKNVWVDIPFDESWTADSELTVIDNGHGMTRDEARTAYLIVGRKRRLVHGVLSEGGRRVHGRKGIGKLAAFGTAGILECTTVRDGEVTAFRLDYDKIRRLTPDTDYPVEPIPAVPLTDPHGNPLTHGTRIRLTRLHLKRAISQPQFLRSMSRRFALDSAQMGVRIGSAELSRFEIPVEFRFPQDGVPNDDIHVDASGWAVEMLNGETVRWWIGFTEKPLDEDQQQGISVIANQKMAQRPFKFERTQGTEGQLGQEYLVGEVEANWLDYGVDIEDDLIQSNRDQLQLEDARLTEFLEWGRKRLTWALRTRNQLRREKAVAAFQTSEELDGLLAPFTATERKNYLRIASTVSKLPEIQPDHVTELMRTVIDSRSDLAVRELMEAIEGEEDVVQERMWNLVHEFGLIDARRLLSVIHARIQTIERLQSALQTGAREVPEIHALVRQDAWLLDPRWHLLGDEIDVTSLKGVAFSPEADDETGKQLDFLFALAPQPPAPLDEVVVIEIKRATDSKGSVRKASLTEVQSFHSYVIAVEQSYGNSSDSPAVRGLMVAQGYTSQANAMRRSLESLPQPRLRFSTWDRIIDDTHRMHLGWLQVSQSRVDDAKL